MVIFHSYVSLPEGIIFMTSMVLLFWQNLTNDRLSGCWVLESHLTRLGVILATNLSKRENEQQITASGLFEGAGFSPVALLKSSPLNSRNHFCHRGRLFWYLLTFLPEQWIASSYHKNCHSHDKYCLLNLGAGNLCSVDCSLCEEQRRAVLRVTHAAARTKVRY